MILAAVRDLHLLFVLLGLVAFAVAIWLTLRAAYIAALVAAVIGVLILAYGA